MSDFPARLRLSIVILSVNMYMSFQLENNVPEFLPVTGNVSKFFKPDTVTQKEEVSPGTLEKESLSLSNTQQTLPNTRKESTSNGKKNTESTQTVVGVQKHNEDQYEFQALSRLDEVDNSSQRIVSESVTGPTKYQHGSVNRLTSSEHKQRQEPVSDPADYPSVTEDATDMSQYRDKTHNGQRSVLDLSDPHSGKEDEKDLTQSRDRTQNEQRSVLDPHDHQSWTDDAKGPPQSNSSLQNVLPLSEDKHIEGSSPDRNDTEKTLDSFQRKHATESSHSSSESQHLTRTLLNPYVIVNRTLNINDSDPYIATTGASLDSSQHEHRAEHIGFSSDPSQNKRTGGVVLSTSTAETTENIATTKSKYENSVVLTSENITECLNTMSMLELFALAGSLSFETPAYRDEHYKLKQKAFYSTLQCHVQVNVPQDNVIQLHISSMCSKCSDMDIEVKAIPGSYGQMMQLCEMNPNLQNPIIERSNLTLQVTVSSRIPRPASVQLTFKAILPPERPRMMLTYDTPMKGEYRYCVQ